MMAQKKAKPTEQSGVSAGSEPAVSPAGSAIEARGDASTKTPWFRFTVMILLGIVYAWDLFTALSNLVGVSSDVARVNEVRAANNFSLIDTPWVALIVNLLLPLIVYGLALWISRRRSVGILAMMLFAGLGVVAALSLSIAAYVRAILPF